MKSMQMLCRWAKVTRVKVNKVKVTKVKVTLVKVTKVKVTKEEVRKVDTKIRMVKEIKAIETPTTNQGEIIVETIISTEEIFPHEETD